METTQEKLLTTGEAAKRLGMRPGHVTRLFERNLVTQVPRIGRIRMIPESMLPQIRAAAIKVGYLEE